jgi:hypothetical protein
MTISEIIKKYLADNGYDGLCLDGEGCGCYIDDLMPCCSASVCFPGYEYNINMGKTCEGCEDECPFLDMDEPISEYGRICSSEDLPVKCRVKPKRDCAQTAKATGIDAVINIIDRSIAISERYKETCLREYYNRDMAAVRDMLAELKNREAADGASIKRRADVETAPK